MATNIYSAVYSGVPVYEMMCRGIAVMRRRADSYLNATQILKVAGIEKGKRTKILEREVLIGEHEKVQGGYGKYQGTWIPFEKGRELAERYQVEPYLRPLMEYDPHAAARSGGVDRTPTKEQAMAAQRKQQQQHPPGPTTPSPLHTTMHGAMSMMANTAPNVSPMTASSPLRGYHQSQEPPRKKMKANSPFSSPANGYTYAESDNSMAHIGEVSNATEGSGERHRAVLMAIFLNEDPNHIPDLLTNPNSPADLDIELIIDDQGHTALHWAAALARINILHLLVNKGTNVRRVNFNGETALMRAVLVTNNFDNQSFPQLLEIIVDSIQICDRKNRTVFHHIALTAGIKGRGPASRYYMECLLEFIARHRGGDFASIVDIQDLNGDTALNIAARVGSKSIVDQLLDVGANRHLENKVGLKPEDFGIEDVKDDGSDSDVGHSRLEQHYSPHHQTRESTPIDGPRSTTITTEPSTSSVQAAMSSSKLLLPSKRGREIVSAAKHESIQFIRSFVSTFFLAKQAVQKIVDDLDAEFTGELQIKQQEIQETQATLRAATKELADARRSIQQLKTQEQQLAEAQQKIINLEAALNQEIISAKSDEDGGDSGHLHILPGDVDAFFNIPDSGFAGSEESGLDEDYDEPLDKNEDDNEKENDASGSVKLETRLEQLSDTNTEAATPSSAVVAHTSTKRPSPKKSQVHDRMRRPLLQHSNGHGLLTREQRLERQVRLLQARVAAYVKNDVELRAQVATLRSHSTERELQCKKLIATCCNIQLEQVDELLQPLMQAVESDGRDLDLSRVAGFMTKVKQQEGVLVSGSGGR